MLCGPPGGSGIIPTMPEPTPAETPALVVSHAGRPDALSSEHRVDDLADAAAQHAERPTIVVVGAGGSPLHNSPGPGKPGRAT